MKVLTIVLVVFGIVGAVLLLAGCVLIPVFKSQIHKKIQEHVVLKNGSETFKHWRSSPVPVYRQFWVFDVLNAKDIVNYNATPKVAQKGPYTYKEIEDKKNIKFRDKATLLSYVQPKSFVFESRLSNGTENDTFTSVDIPLLAVATAVEHAGILKKIAVRIALTLFKRRLFVKHTVKDYLWGYNDSLMTAFTNRTKFGLFVGPTGNGTDDGQYDIFTGTSDIAKLGDIDKWNGNSTLSYWTSKQCNMINGTDGTMWYPFVKKTDTLYVFSSDICRSIYAQYDSSYKLKGVINVHRFVPAEGVFASAKKNPANAGFCTPKNNCLDSGVLNVSECKGAPIVMSQPHFYEGPSYSAAIEGMNPQKENHQTFFDVEPFTGNVLNVAKRLQMNVYLKKLFVLNDTSELIPTVFPIIWLNESAEISNSLANELQSKLFEPIRVSHILEYTLIGVGGFILLVVIIIFIVMAVRSRKEGSGLLTEEEPVDRPEPVDQPEQVEPVEQAGYSNPAVDDDETA